ncbi:DUF4159 domain-containing protein [Falsirhodobacter sp. alg1]|uniref:DUF4159 domain-containing protein n=1 Tax=Falsirhodobacter sp. alg1 TaxID=1472418 RepID=UPI0007883910|nr:DUF4159 domain-containing protein [Falsirhodobacter sp. alg1]
MWTLGPIGFTAPLLLLGLVLLPVLWLLLRAVPPAPVRRRFPGVALLLGLKDADAETDRTPWWLMVLRMAAVAAAIVAFAGPVLNPRAPTAATGPLLVVLDATWADARDWPRRIARASEAVEAASRAGRPVALAALTDDPEPLGFQAAAGVLPRLEGMTPSPWSPRYIDWAADLPEGDFATLWVSDGLDHEGRADLVAALEQRGKVTVVEPAGSVVALRPPVATGTEIVLHASRLPAFDGRSIAVQAIGTDPSGGEQELGRADLDFAANGTEAEATLDLPPELRNRITRFQIDGVRSAGAISLADDSLRRREVALIGADAQAEGATLLDPLFYLRQALSPTVDLIDGSLGDVLPANPDVIVLADVARLGPSDMAGLMEWVQNGGLLLRFAGPRLAAAPSAEDPLLPVPLRDGGRAIGGQLSWGEPQQLAPFPEASPFAGLVIPPEVTVREQVLAQPGPDLTARTIAALEDGTPLVTRRVVGQGQVVLFHVTANAEWSDLPLSGLFVQMLDRLAISSRATADRTDLTGRIWSPDRVMDAFGGMSDAGTRAGVAGSDLAAGVISSDVPPGIYAEGASRVAMNVIGPATELQPAVWPDGLQVEGLDTSPERPLRGIVLALAMMALMLDVLAALALSGRLKGAAVAVVLALALVPSPKAQAQNAVEATSTLRLAYVLTGDAAVDDLSEAGLRGLSARLTERTTIEPGAPAGVDIRNDELAFYPFLYWPVTADMATPSGDTFARLNDYLRTGGLILFDTRDGDVSGISGGTPEGRALQRITAGLDIPPLERIPPDHVLTRTFYLLQDFPGRYNNPALWVEAAPPDAALAEGQPFRHLNDGVTPVVIGSNDWAAAWAVDKQGFSSLPVGRGFGGERQREIATRFGINLIMYVLTGNYKSDQVHVPALLERLGN